MDEFESTFAALGFKPPRDPRAGPEEREYLSESSTTSLRLIGRKAPPAREQPVSLADKKLPLLGLGVLQVQVRSIDRVCDPDAMRLILEATGGLFSPAVFGLKRAQDLYMHYSTTLTAAELCIQPNLNLTHCIAHLGEVLFRTQLMDCSWGGWSDLGADKYGYEEESELSEDEEDWL